MRSHVHAFGTDALAVAVARRLELPRPATRVDDVDPDSGVVVVSAEAHLDRLAPTLRGFMGRGMHVVAACEQMAWPWFNHPHLADVLATEAVRAGVALVGVGGAGAEALAMLAAQSPATGASRDGAGLAGIRLAVGLGPDHCRLAVWQRLGIGVALAKWKTLYRAKTVDFVGVAELTTLLAQALGRHPMHNEVAVDVAPVTDAATNVMAVRAVGRVAVEGLTIECAVEASPIGDGSQSVILTRGAGDALPLPLPAADSIEAAAARLVRAAGQAASLTPGLRTMLDLPAAGT
jgi:4-hydroxy-tetrahydrodipicolinate reductase